MVKENYNRVQNNNENETGPAIPVEIYKFNTETDFQNALVAKNDLPYWANYANRNFAYDENTITHIGSFDHPEKLPPDRHSWVSERVCWHEIKDDLKKFDQLSNVGLPGNTPPYDQSAGC